MPDAKRLGGSGSTLTRRRRVGRASNYGIGRRGSRPSKGINDGGSGSTPTDFGRRGSRPSNGNENDAAAVVRLIHRLTTVATNMSSELFRALTSADKQEHGYWEEAKSSRSPRDLTFHFECPSCLFGWFVNIVLCKWSTTGPGRNGCTGGTWISSLAL